MNHTGCWLLLNIEFFIEHSKTLDIGLEEEFFGRTRQLDHDKKRKVKENHSDYKCDT